MDGQRERFWRDVNEMVERDEIEARVQVVLEELRETEKPWAVYFKHAPVHLVAAGREALWNDVQERLWDAASARDRELIERDVAVRRLEGRRAGVGV